MPGLAFWAAPCRDSIMFFILCWMSDGKLLALGGSGPGLLAALIGPRGDDAEAMFGMELFAKEGGFGDAGCPSISSEDVEASRSPSAVVGCRCSWSAIVGGGRNLQKRLNQSVTAAMRKAGCQSKLE